MPNSLTPEAQKELSHLHAHRHDDAKHQHYFADRSSNVLAWAMGITFLFAGVEFTFGFISHSLALISDAGHMVTDSAALGLALLAQFISKRPPSEKLSFGYGRSEALAAFVNGLLMLAMVIWIAYEAIHRLYAPSHVKGDTVMGVAIIGLLLNCLVAWILSKDQENLNTKSALIHVFGDLLGSLAAIVAGAVIYYTGWMPIDPILSIFVSLLILKSTISVIKDSYHFLMKGVPHHVDFIELGRDMLKTEGVVAVHDLHVWDMSPNHPALIGHVEIEDITAWPRVLESLRMMLLDKYQIEHITLQAEIIAESERCHEDITKNDV